MKKELLELRRMLQMMPAGESKDLLAIEYIDSMLSDSALAGYTGYSEDLLQDLEDLTVRQKQFNDFMKERRQKLMTELVHENAPKLQSVLGDDFQSALQSITGDTKDGTRLKDNLVTRRDLYILNLLGVPYRHRRDKYGFAQTRSINSRELQMAELSVAEFWLQKALSTNNGLQFQPFQYRSPYTYNGKKSEGPRGWNPIMAQWSHITLQINVCVFDWTDNRNYEQRAAILHRHAGTSVFDTDSSENVDSIEEELPNVDGYNLVFHTSGRRENMYLWEMNEFLEGVADKYIRADGEEKHIPPEVLGSNPIREFNGIKIMSEQVLRFLV